VFIGPRRAVLIRAIAAVALTIILIPLIFQATSPNFDLVVIRLTEVAAESVEDESLELKPVFTISNPTDQTITTSKVEYELFADGVHVGSNTITYEDIPLNGRPAIFAQGSVEIPADSQSLLVLEYGDSNAELFEKIRDSPDTVQWSAKGKAQIESTLTFVEREFENEI
jgi:hypothetical protein